MPGYGTLADYPQTIPKSPRSHCWQILWKEQKLFPPHVCLPNLPDWLKLNHNQTVALGEPRKYWSLAFQIHCIGGHTRKTGMDGEHQATTPTGGTVLKTWAKEMTSREVKGK